MRSYIALIHKDVGSDYGVSFPDLPGCITTGATLEDTERNIREAIEGHLETLREFGERVPAPTTVARDVEILSAA